MHPPGERSPPLCPREYSSGRGFGMRAGQYQSQRETCSVLPVGQGVTEAVGFWDESFYLLL